WKKLPINTTARGAAVRAADRRSHCLAVSRRGSCRIIYPGSAGEYVAKRIGLTVVARRAERCGLRRRYVGRHGARVVALLCEPGQLILRRDVRILERRHATLRLLARLQQPLRVVLLELHVVV